MRKGLLVLVVAGAAFGFWMTSGHAGDLVTWWDEVPPVTVLDQKDIGCNSTTGIKTITAMDVARFDGHFCPGIATGFRATQIVFERLFPGEVPRRGDMFVVSGSNLGPVPAIEYITGTRYGPPMGGVFKGNLVVDPGIGRESFIFVRISTGEAYKLTTKLGIPPDEMKILHPKVAGGTANEEETVVLYEMARRWAFNVLTMPENEVFEIEKLNGYDWQKVKKEAWN